MSKLLAYTIGGQIIGIDIQTWTQDMLSGNTAFMTIPDTGSTPNNYTDISSVNYWDNFGWNTLLTPAQIKEEIIKLIPDVPTPEQYLILEKYATVGINSMTKIGATAILGSVSVNDTSLTGVTDIKFNVTGGTVNGDIKTTGTICGVDGTLDVGGNFNLGGSAAIGGNTTMGGNLIVAGAITNSGVVNGATNLGTGEGIYTSLSAQKIQLKSLSGGTNVTLSSDGTTITINASGGASGGITGATNLGTGAGIYVNTVNSNLQFKSLSGGSNVTITPNGNYITISALGGGTGTTITTYETSATGNITTTSTSDTLMTGMQLTNIPAGKYLVGFGTSLSHGSASASIVTSIYANNTIVSNSSLTWTRGSSQGNITTVHGYSNFVITLASTQTVDIRWRTTTGTATANTNRYLTLLKVL
jgi:hypothetical protein